ncbi:PIR Superfamily Protein [Plasmodium ovale wallikeri]|uniref:PIR Superfamily Protein n=1 Tax=Plasmodium ovale wallikeri TaxID=864142 RepID=A0A1A9AKH7_PLAOA|nr:PIR Superfamily Protein [Plasmodium ovale wallikeri]SBT56585.1 PIR Superfamily Protein [Plasmodium ovale wallikeri]
MTGGSADGPKEFAENLNSLPSNIFYNNIKRNHSDLSDYSYKCDTTSAKYYKNEAKLIYEKIIRYLDKHTELIDNKTEYDVCMLLNYWIYDVLTEIRGFQNISKNFILAFSHLQIIWCYPNAELKKTTYYNKCNQNFDIFNPDYWNE